MRYIVTGCVGFIGSQVVRQLLGDGHSVVGIDDLNDAYDPRLKHWRIQQLAGNPKFTFQRGDISSIATLCPVFAMGDCDGVFNLAARAGVRQSMANPWIYLDTNATGTLNVLELARVHDIKKIVTASTSSLYGRDNPRPFREDANTDRPLSPYAASKKAAESMSAAYAHLYGLDTPICRYFTVYGPAGRPDMSMFRFIRWIAEDEPMILYGDGSQVRDFTYVDDVACGTILAIEKTSGHDIYNLGGDHPVKLSEMIALIEKLLGKRARIDRRPFHIADVPATWADVTKARTKLGWKSKVSFEEGVARCVEWYLRNREFAQTLNLGD